MCYSGNLNTVATLPSMSSESFTKEANHLLARACPNAAAEMFSNHHMLQAKALGMTWVEGLRHVILQRQWNGGLATIANYQRLRAAD